jgi:hypothetical protein
MTHEHRAKPIVTRRTGFNSYDLPMRRVLMRVALKQVREALTGLPSEVRHELLMAVDTESQYGFSPDDESLVNRLARR